jgi:2-iminobutanoate/2-iminopropanoate deaminase
MIIYYHQNTYYGGQQMKKIISADNAPQPIGPYSQGVSTNGFLFVSGQLPLDVKTGDFAEGGIEEQTNQALRNLKSILEAANSDLSLVLKTTVFLSDMNNFSLMNKIYEKFFEGGNFPARSVIEVARLPKDALVEVEAIATHGN